jgi:O-antigen biosynthesis protein
MADRKIHRALMVTSDYSGCGAWRTIWPAESINFAFPYAKKDSDGFNIDVTSSCILDANYYRGTSAVRLQRVAGNNSLMYMKYLNGIKKDAGFKLYVDYDDWLFGIPSFNQASKVYTPEVLKSSGTAMVNADGVSVSTTYLKNLVCNSFDISPGKVLVMPNRLPAHFRFGVPVDGMKGHVNRLVKSRNNKKPKVLWTGSASHINQDDPGGVDDISDLRRLFSEYGNTVDWHIVGVNREIALKSLALPTFATYYPWCDVNRYYYLLSQINPDVSVVPLVDCDFNRAKSNIKLLEFANIGVPVICQDIEPYKFATSKFKRYDGLKAEFDKILGNKDYATTVAMSQIDFVVDNGFYLDSPVAQQQFMDMMAGNLSSMAVARVNEKIV